MLKDGTLANAITAPGPRQHQHVDLPPELGEKLPLGSGQLCLAIYSLPTAAVAFRAMFRQKVAHSQTVSEFAVQIHRNHPHHNTIRSTLLYACGHFPLAEHKVIRYIDL
jgi:hypothetical protein